MSFPVIFSAYSTIFISVLLPFKMNKISWISLVCTDPYPEQNCGAKICQVGSDQRLNFIFSAYEITFQPKEQVLEIIYINYRCAGEK
jgi:hypothetical protein